MNPLNNILPAGQVLLDLESSSKKRVFEQVGMVFESNLGLSRAVVFDSLFAREKLGSTGLGQGVAIPHGRIKGLKQAAGAFVRLKTPVPFDAPDGRAVNLLFFLLVPEQATEHHLEILSELAQRFAERPFRDALAAAPDPAAVIALFQN
ncbi:MAG: PTS IIA-like nitrogen regulatory protein PtsN [Candidatus Dechloromonas phosphoritropha]|nr:PTS IIA-like nitrogen regulatory protein PtsN [Candidatus Dechloromonas phosphoritropha]MBP8787417.1 PTS IIA-like nitrogen regulatory protein PtsN [Azonexus sp.]MBP9227991.1 PTS IIA-like nitrogen regulatory protein PtsN [Azonexus sp.]